MAKESMKKLYYICQWGNDRKKAWSGTYLSLFESLKDKFDVIDTPIEQSLTTRIRNAMVRRGWFAKYDFAYSALKKNSEKVLDSINDTNFCTLQFAELPMRRDVHSYIYLDMCAQYIEEVFMTDPATRKHYFRKNVDLNALHKRCELQNELLKGCAGIFTMSEWLTHYLVDRLGVSQERIHCVGAGVEIDIKRLKPDRKGNKILFVGVDFDAKGGSLVVEAFKILREKYLNNAELYIIGPATNPLPDNIPGVFYGGYVNSEQIMHYYSICDVFCMPSYVDAFGKVFVEALCCGLPCIGRNVLSMNEIIQNGVNGYNIDRDDPELLAGRMYDLLHDETIRNYVGTHSVEWQKQYSWDNIASQIAEVIEKDEFYKTVSTD